jgi:hypothetical protein
MDDIIQRPGDTKHPKRKGASDFLDWGKNSRQNFDFLKFSKIVSGNTHKTF